MAINSSDKLVVVKAFAPSNPLPLDARELYDNLAAAQQYAASAANAYAGQTIKVVEDEKVTVYTLVPSTTEGVNFDLSFVGGGAGSGVQDLSTSATEGNVSVVVGDGETTSSKNVPVVGALVNPVVDEDAHTLTLTKLGATAAANTEVVIPLGGASPATIISAVEKGTEGLSIKVKKFDVEAETEVEEVIDIFGAVTDIDGSVAGLIDFVVPGADGTDVHTKEALVGSVINASYDSASMVLTLPVVTGVSAEGVVTTQAVAVDLKAAVAGAFVDVAVTGDTEDSSAKMEFKYKDAAGVEQKKAVYAGGVRKVAAGSSVDKIKVTTGDATTGALTDTEILVGAGSVKNPTYDSETRKITLPILQADGTTSDLAINLGKDMVVKSGSYDTVNKNIVLVLTDDSQVTIAASDLVDIYTGEATQTATVNVSDDNKITVDVKVAADEKNLLKVDTENGGLYVKEADFADTKKLISDGDAQALADAKAHSDAELAKEVTARGEAIEAAKTEVKGYTDTEVGKEKTAREEADAQVLADAKADAEQKVAAEKAEREAADTQNLAAAKTYAEEQAAAAKTYAEEQIAAESEIRVAAEAQVLADAKADATNKVAAEKAEREAADAQTLKDAKAYSDAELAKEVEARGTAVSEAIAEVKGYTDTEVAEEAEARAAAVTGALNDAKAHSDAELAKEVTARETADTNNLATAKSYAEEQANAALTSAKEYAEQQAASVSTTWVDFGTQA